MLTRSCWFDWWQYCCWPEDTTMEKIYWEVQGAKLPLSTSYAKHGEAIHIHRCSAARFCSLHVKSSVLKLLSSEIVGDLTFSQEEADTRMLLHAKHASSDYEAMVIVSEGTYVFIICLAVFRQIPGKIYIRCGTKNRLRQLTLAKLAICLGKIHAKPYYTRTLCFHWMRFS